ncbi:hypothetical protein PhCBS80983_g03766 [Powellomyces hirtus]|uniref:Uncharacterized protein n=1 Tax=Powellomyces hirtus TaxID=109895 RepID=A0A507E340_9FUNG|nr:hypothetical protein PhCBS80983_g03766 [Powellomyces hirtus]
METHPQEDTPERHNDISMAQRRPGTVSAAHDALKLRDMIPTNIEPVPLNHTSAHDNYTAPVATDQHHVAPSADRRTSIVASQTVRDDAADDDFKQPIVEHIPGEFPDDRESTYEGYSSDEEPTITEFVSNAASAATSFFRNVSRRVSRNIESIDIPAADKQSSTTTTATTASTGVLPSNIAGSIVGSAAAVANKAKESLGNLYQTTTAKLAVPGQSSEEAAAHGVYSLDDSTPTKLEDVTRQVFAESTLPVPSVQTSITEPTDELPGQDTVLAVPATAMDQPELVGDIMRETAVIGVSPVTGQPQVLADVVQEAPVVAVAKAQPTQVVETHYAPAPAVETLQYPVIVPGAAQSPVTTVVETACDTVTKVAAAAPEKIHATKETAIGAYESARDTVSHVSAVAPETIQVTKEAAANSYGSSYDQAAARTANLPVVAKETVHKAVATVQETTAKVQETIARTVDTAQHSVAAEKARELASSAAVSREAAGESYSTSYEQAAARTANLPVVAKETAQKAVATVQETARTTKETVGQTVDTIVNSAAADKAREIVYTAQIVAEDAANATVAAVSTAAAKTAETSRAVYGVAADTSSRAVSTTSEVVSPAIAATRESTITSYHQSEERTTEILEHARDIAVEYGTTAKVLATDALHKVEDAAVYVYHHTSEGAVSTAHKAAHVGEVAYHSTADALTAAKHVAENVAHRAVDGAVVAKDASVRSATVASNRVAEVSAPVVQAASNAGRAVANTASSAATATANTVSGATRAVVNTASNAATATANTVGGATRAVANTASNAATATANTVGGATRAVVNTASNAASATANTVTGATRSIGNTASNAVTATKNTVTGFTTRSAAPADTDATREVAGVDSARADVVVPKEGWKIKETVTNTASNVLNNAVAVPKAAATGVAHAATAVGSAVGSAASTAARTVVAVPVAIGHGVVNTASAVGQGVSNAATGTVNTVKAIPSAATNTATNAASSLASLPTTIKSVLPGGTSAAKETPATVVPETGATVPVEWRQGVADSTELKEEQEATPLEDIVYAEEMERTRREQPGATARQFADHAREEATAFTEGIRAHLGESSEIPALAVPRREWAREAEEVERQDRVEAQARQRSLASQQAHAFAHGLSSVSGDGDHLKSVASHAQALKLEGDIEAERESRVSEPNEDGAHSVAAAVQAGISEQGNPAVHIAQRELTRSAEETARDERTSESSQMHDQQTAEKVASLFQAGLGGANTTSPAADVAKIALIRTAEDTERDERIEDGWKHQPHAHSEARLVQEAFEEGVELNPVHGGYKLAEVRNVEEQERERRIREEGDHSASTAAAGAVRDAIHNADADAPAALHVAERELVRSAEEEERLDRMASNDGLRTAGSPTQIAFALRAGLLRDGERNPAIDVARSAAEYDEPSSSRSAKAAVGVTPSTLNAAPSDARNRVFKQDQTEHVQPATFQDWGAHNNSLLGHDSLSAGQEPLSVPTSAADVKEPEPDVVDDAILGDIGDGNRSPPSTPMEGDLPPSSSTVPRIHTTSLADQRATLHPKTSHTNLSLSPTSDHRPPTPSRDDSTAVDQIGLETIRPNPLDDPNAQIVSTTPTTPLTERRQSTPSPTDSGSSSRRSSGSGGDRTPHRLHALKEKAIGKIEHTIGKVVHSEHLKVEGSARQAAGAAELQAVKERRKSADYSSRTSSPTH